MQELLQSNPAHLLHAPIRPRVESYDSGEEFSLGHWMDICLLVNQADMPIGGLAEELPPEFERALEQTILEVETATAN